MSDWISVKEKTPNDGEKVLLLCFFNNEEYTVFIGFLSGLYFYSGSSYPVKATHWMALPKVSKDLRYD